MLSMRARLHSLLRSLNLQLRLDPSHRHLGLYQLPKSSCWNCGGDGGWYDGSNETEDGWWEICPCASAEPVLSLPTRSRTTNAAYSQEPPF
ncbi:hypothetical protein [Kitasatospora sp. NPDC002040]|uniref:hypothetical protein n=1 Tax=Kitasatospora sp. NPDC002040 TaxID=3154661 RepID=UPI0033281E3C